MRNACIIFSLVVSALGAQSPADQFETRVRPLLAAKCQGCHNAKTPTAGLDLSTSAGLRKLASPNRLLEVTAYDGKTKMPPEANFPTPNWPP